MPVSPFTIDIAGDRLDDLRQRLSRTRLTSEVVGAGWDYGTSRAYLKELVDYWQEDFDWRAEERALNQFSHFRADIDGFGLHFIHERGKGPHPLPIILTHGWPDSFYRMLKLIPLLTDPAAHGADETDAFDVVVPSLPGFGFSDKPANRGMTVDRVAELSCRLMSDVLGYHQFAAHGSDIGSGVTQELARNFPASLIGIHLTDVPYLNLVRFAGKDENLTGEEEDYLSRGRQWAQTEGAYSLIQSTKPQTLAFCLNDSPAGLASWIVEKYRAWSDCDGNVENRFTKDELLTNVMICWVTETIGSSFLLYYEPAHDPTPGGGDQHVEVPAGFVIFPHDIVPAPKVWAERFFNVLHWSELPAGGHFAAMEEPELLATDVRAMFRPFR